MDHETDRRQFLRLTAGGAALMAGPALALEGQRGQFPPDVGSKFDADGRVHSFPGNTVICHLPQQGPDSACFDAMLDIYRDAPRHGFARKVALLPPSSYHMTVFGGANDRPRQPQSWPADLPFDLPLAQCNRILADRLRAAHITSPLPLRMRVDPVQDPVNGRPLTLRLLPFDASEHGKLASLRQQIAKATAIPLPQPDAYQFHISIGYAIAWLTAAEEVDFKRTFRGWAKQLARAAPVITLGAVEFCTFEDMFAFRRVMFLS